MSEEVKDMRFNSLGAGHREVARPASLGAGLLAALTRTHRYHHRLTVRGQKLDLEESHSCNRKNENLLSRQ